MIMAINASNMSNVSNVTNASVPAPTPPSGLDLFIQRAIAQVVSFFNVIWDWFLSQPGVQPAIEFIIYDYIYMIPDKIAGLLVGKGDISALVVVMVFLYVSMKIAHSLTEHFMNVVKNLMILTIIIAAYYSMFLAFVRGLGPDAPPLFVLIGGLVLALGFVAILLSLYFVVFHTKKTVKHKKAKEAIEKGEEAELEEAGGTAKVGLKEPDIKEAFSITGLRKGVEEGKHTLTTMFVYMLIAEFGVFSSPTLSAPSVPVGIGLLVAFFIGVSVYLFRSSEHPIASLKLLFFASILGFILSVLLGVYFAQLGWDVVLSPQYFSEDTLIAFLTGVALSLFMAGKELQKE